MKLRGITLGGSSDELELDTIDVTMTRNEAALIYKVFGGLSPAAVIDVLGSDLVEALEGLCELCVPFNMVYEGGVDDVVMARGGGAALFERQRNIEEERGK